MAPPSQLKIATDAVNRLAKELKSYYKELEQQESKLASSKSNDADEDENAEYLARQQEKAVEETRNTIPSIRSKLAQAIEGLDRELEASSGSASEAELAKAKEVKEAAVLAQQS